MCVACWWTIHQIASSRYGIGQWITYPYKYTWHTIQSSYIYLAHHTTFIYLAHHKILIHIPSLPYYPYTYIWHIIQTSYIYLAHHTTLINIPGTPYNLHTCTWPTIQPSYMYQSNHTIPIHIPGTVASVLQLDEPTATWLLVQTFSRVVAVIASEKKGQRFDPCWWPKRFSYMYQAHHTILIPILGTPYNPQTCISQTILIRIHLLSCFCNLLSCFCFYFLAQHRVSFSSMHGITSCVNPQ